MSHRTFLSVFILYLAICAGAFFATMAGVPQTIWRNDLSYMTSVIGVVFVGTAAWLGRQAWQIDTMPRWLQNPISHKFGVEMIDTAWAREAAEICAMLGLVGTVIGLSMQAKVLISGTASFGALSTSLFTTACGAAAAIMLKILTHVVESGARRAR